MSLCLSLPLEKFNATAKKKISNAKNGTINVQKKQPEGRGQQERVHLCLKKFSPIEAKQTLFLIMLKCHWSAVWKSGYTSDAVSVELRTRVVRILYS